MSEPCLATEQRTVPAAELAAWLRDAGVTVVVAAPGAGPATRRAVGPDLPVTERPTDEPLPLAAAGVAAVPGRCVALVAEATDGWSVLVTPGTDPAPATAAPPPAPPPAGPPCLACPGSVWVGYGLAVGFPVAVGPIATLRVSIATAEVQVTPLVPVFMQGTWRLGLTAPLRERTDRAVALGVSAGGRSNLSVFGFADSSWNLLASVDRVRRLRRHTAGVLRLSVGLERWRASWTLPAADDAYWAPLIELATVRQLGL